MSDAPFIKFYPSDFLAGTSGLSPAERGVYITLLCLIYEMDGSIVRDDIRLSRRCGSSKAAFTRILFELINQGKITEIDGMLSNRRAEKALADRTNRTQNASNAANQRWSVQSKKTQQKQRPFDAAASPTQCVADAIPEARSQKEKKDNKLSQKRLREGEAELLTVLNEKTARAVVDHRIKIKRPLTPRAAELLANQFGKCADPNAAADTMIVQGWQGFNPEWIKPDAIAAGINITTIKPNQWRSIMDRYDRTKFWHQSYGPPPGESGCEVPPEYLKQSEAAE